MEDQSPPPPPQPIPKLAQMGKYVTQNFLLRGDGLFKQQRNALENVREWIIGKNNMYTSVVVMPSGTGKSGVICCLPFVLGEIAYDSPTIIDLSNPILVLVPGIDIMKQLEDDLLYRPLEAGTKPFLIRRYPKYEEFLRESYYHTHVVQDNADRYFGNCEIVLTNVQKFRNLDNLPAHMFSAVIVDEAHHLPAPQWQRIVDHFQKHAKIIFFTSTPYREDGQLITADGALKLCGYAYHLTLEQAVKDNLIRDVTFEESHSNNKVNARVAVLRKVWKSLEEKDECFPLPGQQHHVAILVTKIIAEAKDIKKLCTEMFKCEDAIVSVNSSTVKAKQRNEVVQAIKEGRYRIIIVVGMLLEGFDCPSISIAGILTKITSRVKFAHFVGRIRRKVREPKLEQNGISGDIVTDSFFEQKTLYDNYKSNRIAEEWDQEQEEQEDPVVKQEYLVVEHEE